MSSLEVVERITPEIYSIGQLIEPERAKNLGATIRQLVRMDSVFVKIKDNNPESLSETTLGPESTVNLSQSDWKLYKEVHSEVVDITTTTLSVNDAFVRGDFLLGAFQEWHADPQYDFRTLVNLSANPITLKIATDWEHGIYMPIATRKNPEPRESVALTYGTGEAIVVNNIVGNGQRRPHAGVKQPNRVQLRFFGMPKS